MIAEASWLGTDFSDEKNRHAKSRKKVVNGLISYFKSLESKEERAEKEAELQLRKISAKICKEVKGFWLKINKFVAYKQKLENDEARRKAMDQHLNFLVNQTETTLSLYCLSL